MATRANFPRAVLAVTVCLMLATISFGATPASSVLVTVDAQADGRSAQYIAEFDVATIDGQYNWGLEEPVILTDQQTGTQLGTLWTLGLVYKGDPAIAMDFSLEAASAATSFTITSALLNFPTISNPLAYATGALTLTDLDQDQASLAGLLGGGATYQGMFNNSAASWANLLTLPVNAPQFGSVGVSDRTPVTAGTWGSVGSPVSSMQAKFSFQLSDHDSASGTSMFEVVPEPTTFGLIAVLGGLFVLRRR